MGDVLRVERRYGIKQAVDFFLQRLNECREPGWYTSFMTALRDAGRAGCLHCYTPLVLNTQISPLRFGAESSVLAPEL